MMWKEIDAGLSEPTNLRFVRTLKEDETATREMLVIWLTTELKSFTILISIKPSSVHSTSRQKVQLLPEQIKSDANTVSFARSLILEKSCLLSWSKTTRLTWTSTCITSRLSGALTETMTTTGRCACMLIIGKITGGSHQYSLTNQRCAIVGRRIILLELT
jgi:hypothetical protein